LFWHAYAQVTSEELSDPSPSSPFLVAGVCFPSPPFLVCGVLYLVVGGPYLVGGASSFLVFLDRGVHFLDRGAPFLVGGAPSALSSPVDTEPFLRASLECLLGRCGARCNGRI